MRGNDGRAMFYTDYTSSADTSFICFLLASRPYGPWSMVILLIGDNLYMDSALLCGRGKLILDFRLVTFFRLFFLNTSFSILILP